MGYNLNLWSVKWLGSAYAVLILSVNFTSAGLLKSIREAAEPKDMDFKLPLEEASTGPSIVPDTASSTESTSSPAPPKIEAKMDHVVTPSEETLLKTLQTSLSKLSTVLLDRADAISAKGNVYNYKIKASCKPGDVLCQAKLSMGMGKSQAQVKNEMSKAIVKSFGSMMSEMVNSTISKGLSEFMKKHGKANGETVQEEQQAMAKMAADVLQTASSRVIKSFTFFTQMAISGAMWDLFNNLVTGVTSAVDRQQRSMNQIRGNAALNSPPERIPKPSLINPAQQVFDPVKTILNAGALTALSFPSSGFDLMGSLKSNLLNGDTNELTKKSGTSTYVPSPVLTPFGVLGHN